MCAPIFPYNKQNIIINFEEPSEIIPMHNSTPGKHNPKVNVNTCFLSFTVLSYT